MVAVDDEAIIVVGTELEVVDLTLFSFLWVAGVTPGIAQEPMVGTHTREFFLGGKWDGAKEGGCGVGSETLRSEMAGPQSVPLQDYVNDPWWGEEERHVVDDFALPCFLVIEQAGGDYARLRPARFGHVFLGAFVNMRKDGGEEEELGF